MRRAQGRGLGFSFASVKEIKRKKPDSLKSL